MRKFLVEGTTLLRCGGSCAQRGLVRLPGWAAFFPLVVGKLFDRSAVIAHDEDFAIGLRCANQHRLRL